MELLPRVEILPLRTSLRSYRGSQVEGILLEGFICRKMCFQTRFFPHKCLA